MWIFFISRCKHTYKLRHVKGTVSQDFEFYYFPNLAIKHIVVLEQRRLNPTIQLFYSDLIFISFYR